jgi:integrase
MTTRRGWGSIKRLPSGNWRASYQHRGDPYAADTTFACECKGDCRGAPDPDHPKRKPCEGHENAAHELRKIRDNIRIDPDWPAKHKREREAEKAERARPKGLTVAAYAEQWLERKRHQGKPLSPNTLDGYRYYLDKHVLPAFGAHLLDAVTRQQVQAWYDRLLPGKPAARALAYGTLVGVYASAVDEGLLGLKPSPCRVKGGMSKPRVKPRPTVPPDEEVQAMVAAMVEATPPRFRLMLLIACYGGLRFGEIAELRRKDIDVDRCTIGVHRAIIRPRTGPVVKTPKSEAGHRSVALPNWIQDRLRAHLEEHTGPGKEDLLFPNYRGQQLSYSGRDLWWIPARRAGGWEGSFHDLRHLEATLFDATGASIRESMVRHGWTTPAMAMTYHEAAAERQQMHANQMPEPGGNVVPITTKRRRKTAG